METSVNLQLVPMERFIPIELLSYFTLFHCHFSKPNFVYSGNADRGSKLKGHHWGILGLISWEKTSNRYWCWVTKMRLISGKLNPFQFNR